MAVKSHILKVELVLVTVFVHEGGFQFSFSTGVEALNFNLFGEVHAVAAEEFEDGFFGAPVDG